MKKDKIIILLFFILLCLVFYRVLFLKYIFSDSDIFQIYFPYQIYTSNTIRDGFIPLWSPEIGFGHPFLADGQAGVFYPLNILMLFFPYISTVNFLLIFHYFLAGFFLYIFAKELQIKGIGLIISIAIYVFSGFATAHFRHIIIIDTMVWLPLCFFLLHRMLKTNKIIYCILLTIIFSISFFAFHPQTFLIILSGLYIYFIVVYFHYKKNKNIIVYFFLFQFFTLLLISLQLLPTFELLKNSIRESGLPYSDTFFDALPPRKILSLFLPSEQMKITSWEISAGYVGLVSLFLALIGILTKKNKLILPFIIIIFFSIIMSFGGYFPLYKYLYKLPVINFFKCNVRFLILFIFSISLLAGWGFNKFKTSNFFKISILFLLLLDLYLFSVKKNIVYIKKDEFYRKFKNIEMIKDRKFSTRILNLGGFIPPNINLLYNIYSANIYSPIMIKNYSDNLKNIIYRPDLFSIKYIITKREIVDVKQVHPRVWIVHKIKDVKNKRCEDTISDKKFNFDKEIILQNNEYKKFKHKIKTDNNYSEDVVKILKYAPQKIEIYAKLTSAGFLILNDIYYPGWKVFVSGEKRKILLADCLFRGVFLEKGEYTIVFNYQPISFVIGCIVSFSAIVVILCFCFLRIKI